MEGRLRDYSVAWPLGCRWLPGRSN